MTIVLLPFFILLAGLVASTFLLGFRVGGDHLREEVVRVKLDSLTAQREIHDLTRNAFVAIAEAAERRQR